MYKSWYRIENKADETAEIYIYDEISIWGVSAAEFVKDLNSVTAKTINLHINSPGGNVFDGVTIYNNLKSHKATINTKIDGLAASIASVIALAGDTVDIAKNAMMMIHKAWTYAAGNENDMRNTADVLAKIDTGVILSTYVDKTGMDAADLEGMMAAETWLTAQEAKDYGFADTIGGEAKAKGSFKVLAKYSKVPQEILDRFAESNTTTERDMEHILRDAGGLSISQAKAAVQFVKNLRDAGDNEETEAQKFKDYMQFNLLKTAMQ